MQKPRDYRLSQLCSTATAARQMGVAVGSVANMIRRGVLTGVRLEGQKEWLVVRAEVDSYQRPASGRPPAGSR